MKKRAFLFNASDFLIGTSFMTNEQVGKYIRLLLYSYEVGPLSREQIIHISGEYDDEVMKKFQKNLQGNYYHHRIERERNKADIDVLGFSLRKEYHKDKAINSFAIIYSKNKGIHINKEQIAQLVALFNDKRFKRETILGFMESGFSKWMTHAGSDKHNWRYLYAIIHGDLEQAWAKHKEVSALKKKAWEKKQIEDDIQPLNLLEDINKIGEIDSGDGGTKGTTD